jgi:hypothetical protein
MTAEDSHDAPFETDDNASSIQIEPSNDPRADEVQVHEDPLQEAELSEQESAQLAELTKPYVGQWNQLISTTNWEKGHIISEWRAALIESDADSTQYSDEAWARRVGGVTAPHVGRLRRVYDRFGSTYETYDGIYWTHFLAALDWDDAPLWLEGASKENWSVAGMRQNRWEAHGAVESQRPTDAQIITVDTDEDVVLPAQGGGRTKEYGDEPSGVASGPTFEGPDFGDEEELTSAEAPGAKSKSKQGNDVGDEEPTMVQPFVGLPDLPDDLSDAIEMLKLAVLRHKSDGWRDVDVETVQKYLDAVGVMLRA